MYTTSVNVLLLVLAGGATGVLGAVLGTGGGVFLVPILALGFGVPMHHAVATSIVSVIATSTAAASTNVEHGLVNMRLGMTLEIATALGAIAGGITAGLLSARVLEGVFAGVLLPTAALMWRGGTPRSEPPDGRLAVAGDDVPLGALGARFLDEAEERRVAYRVERLWAGLGISLLAGNLSGLLGIGGGTFKVPALHLACGVPMKAAAATSNFMIGVTAAASAFLFYGRGEVRPALTAAVVLGVLGGSSAGAWAGRHLRSRLLTRLFAVLLLAVAAEMLARVVGR
jgi:uncharacterized membrane protein YfcA